MRVCECVLQAQGRGGEAEAVCVCMYVCVCVAVEDYLRDGLNKTDAIISSLDLSQAVTEVIPVVLPLAKKGCLLFLVKLKKVKHC